MVPLDQVEATCANASISVAARNLKLDVLTADAGDQFNPVKPS